MIKPQITNKLQNPKEQKLYDLEERTFQFAKSCAEYIKSLPRSLSIIEYGKQLLRSSASVGANYIEAKESCFWIRFIYETNADLSKGVILFKEATELKKIFSSILQK